MKLFDKWAKRNIFSRPAPSIEEQLASGLDPNRVVDNKYVVEAPITNRNVIFVPCVQNANQSQLTEVVSEQTVTFSQRTSYKSYG